MTSPSQASSKPAAKSTAKAPPQPEVEWIDSHCHLAHPSLPKTVDELVSEAHAGGISQILTICCETHEIPKLMEIADSHSEVYFTAGVHPHDVTKMADGDIEKIREAHQHPKCRAVGEIGLDYFYDNSPRDIQCSRLEQQLELALELEKPIVVHSRDSEADLLPRLTTYAKSIGGSRSPGVIHCFTGTQAFGQACLDLGFYISISGVITFGKADELREAVRSFPSDRLLVETDSPFLAPKPFRGKKCEPTMVRWTAHALAELVGVTPEELSRTTLKNTRELFELPPLSVSSDL